MTVWRYVPLRRPTGYEVVQIHSQPGFYGGRFHPRRLGPSGILVKTTGERSGFELWGEDEKLEVWPAQTVTLEEVAAIDSKAGSLTTKEGAVVRTEVARKALSAEEYRSVQQERTIAALAEVASVKAEETRVRSEEKQRCATCGWIHDARFSEIVIPRKPPLILSGVPQAIFARVHAAHERKERFVSTKDDALLKLCGGYGHPCKAFHGLRQSAAYKALFDTSRRGFIALRGFDCKGL